MRTRRFQAVGLALLAAALLLSPTRSAHADFVDGLLNYWPFEGTLEDDAHGRPGAASTVADDGVFDGTNGTSGITYALGKFGAGVEQDGAAGAAQDNGFVRIARSADTLRGGQDISISAWVQMAGADTSWQTILSHGEGSQYRIARRGESNPPIASYAGGVGDIPTADTTGPPIGIDNGWHHIVAISESGVSTRLWVDGLLVETGGAPTITDNGNDGTPGGSTPDLYIGANPQTGGQNREWWGGIDDVAIWDRPLEEFEIQVLYLAGSDPTTPLPLSAFLPPVPEPSSFALVSIGLLGVSRLRRRK